jgi:hypothetical protein
LSTPHRPDSAAKTILYGTRQPGSRCTGGPIRPLVVGRDSILSISGTFVAVFDRQEKRAAGPEVQTAMDCDNNVRQQRIYDISMLLLLSAVTCIAFALR